MSIISKTKAIQAKFGPLGSTKEVLLSCSFICLLVRPLPRQVIITKVENPDYVFFLYLLSDPNHSQNLMGSKLH